MRPERALPAGYRTCLERVAGLKLGAVRLQAVLARPLLPANGAIKRLVASELADAAVRNAARTDDPSQQRDPEDQVLRPIDFCADHRLGGAVLVEAAALDAFSHDANGTRETSALARTASDARSR